MRYTTSRIAIAVAMAVGVVAAQVAPAFADVDVFVDVSKTKTIDVDETITKVKRVTLEVTAQFIGEGAAEAQALANVLNTNNSVDLEDVVYAATMTNSVNDNTGITQYNQAVGNMQNQGNVVAVAFAATGDTFVNAQAEVDQVNTDGPEGGLSITGSSFSASMTGAVKNNTGITQVNQDSGNMNNQTNAVAAAAGIETAAGANDGVLVALSEAALGQTNTDHDINLSNNQQSATMTGSVIGNQGITHVNQSSGNYANQANVASVGAAIVQF